MAETKSKVPTLPTPLDFFLSVPLYKDFPLDEGRSDGFYAIEYFCGTIDCFCEGCGRHSVFRNKEKKYQPVPDKYVNYVFSLLFTCSRHSTHELFFVFRAHAGKLQKFGQYPSLADLATPDLQKYRKVLGDERFRELTRAVGLVSHGVGIGAFVYLRRIFEALIEKAHTQAAEIQGWSDEPYGNARIDEKIALLKAHLPQFLVENRSLYGILSTGIHSLSEDQCLQAFPVVKLGIELILDEELEKTRTEEKIDTARKGLAALGVQFKHSGN